METTPGKRVRVPHPLVRRLIGLLVQDRGSLGGFSGVPVRPTFGRVSTAHGIDGLPQDLAQAAR